MTPSDKREARGEDLQPSPSSPSAEDLRDYDDLAKDLRTSPEPNEKLTAAPRTAQEEPELADIVDRLLGMTSSFGFKEAWVDKNLRDAIAEIKALRATSLSPQAGVDE